MQTRVPDMSMGISVGMRIDMCIDMCKDIVEYPPSLGDCCPTALADTAAPADPLKVVMAPADPLRWVTVSFLPVDTPLNQYGAVTRTGP